MNVVPQVFRERITRQYHHRSGLSLSTERARANAYARTAPRSHPPHPTSDTHAPPSPVHAIARTVVGGIAGQKKAGGIAGQQRPVGWWDINCRWDSGSAPYRHLAAWRVSWRDHHSQVPTIGGERDLLPSDDPCWDRDGNCRGCSQRTGWDRHRP